MLLLLAALYVPFGFLHLASPDGMVGIVPPGIPFPREIVLFTGLCEIAGGVGLLIPSTRRTAAIWLAAYALCVWPANIWHAIAHVHVGGIPDSWWYHGPRLAFQPVFAWWPLFAARLTDWPFPRRQGAGGRGVGA